MRSSGFPEFRDTTVYDMLYDYLESRPEGVSLQTLSRWTKLSVGTVRKNLKRLESDLVVERVVHSDQVVWRLTTADSIFRQKKKELNNGTH